MSQTRINLTAIAIACALPAAAVGCGDDEAAAPGATTATTGSASSTPAKSSNLAGKTVADIANIPNAFITCLRGGYIGELKKRGAKTFTVYGKFTPTDTQKAVESTITRAPDLAVYLSEIPAVDTQSLNKLKRAKIPTAIALSGTPEGTTPNGVLNFDYEQNSQGIAAKVVELDPDIKKVGIVTGIPGLPTSDLTDSTLKTAFKAKGITVESSLPGMYTAQGGATATEDILQSNPDVQAIVVLGDDGALAATRAIAKAGKDIPVIAMYAISQAVIDQVSSGKMLLAQSQPVQEWGKQIADVLDKVAGGETVAEQELPFNLVDKSNAGSNAASC